jgi:hypothetical protein
MATLGGILSGNRPRHDGPAAFEPVDNGGKIGKVSPLRHIG